MTLCVGEIRAHRISGDSAAELSNVTREWRRPSGQLASRLEGADSHCALISLINNEYRSRQRGSQPERILLRTAFSQIRDTGAMKDVLYLLVCTVVELSVRSLEVLLNRA